MSKEYPVANYRDYTKTSNPYGEIIAKFIGAEKFSTILCDAGTEQSKGVWRGYFQKPEGSFLNLELGAYHGETSIHLARTNPDICHLAVEWKFKQCFKAGKKAKDAGLKNLTFLRANIARLPWMVKAGEVDRVWVLFPDPWSKTSQQKHRLLQADFFRVLGVLLAEGKALMIKTDHQEYSEYIAASLKEAGCFDLMEKESAEKIWAMIPPTPFERIFLRQSLPIYSFALRRNAKSVVPPKEVQDKLAWH